MALLAVCDRCGLQKPMPVAWVAIQGPPDGEQVIFCSWDCVRLYALDRANKSALRGGS